MNEVSLQYSITTQQQPSFINTTLKNTFIRHKANLSDVILNEPDNSSPPSVSGGGNFIRLGDIWLQMPLLWSENAVDGFLNHEHNNGKSILMTIDSLPDKYSQEKSGQWKTWLSHCGVAAYQRHISGQLKVRW